MKKILSLILCMVFLISFASALEFDNKYTYDKITKTAIIKNSILGIPTTSIAKASLNTPQNYKVPIGYTKVAEIKIEGFQDYKEFMKDVEFYDMNKGLLKINRDFDLKFRTHENIKVEDYKTICSLDEKTFNKSCERILDGYHLEEKEIWKKVTPAEIKKNEFMVIGLFTDVKEGDKVEWIPTLAGVKIPEWASWEASLNVDILNYWKVDNNDFSDELGNNDLSNTGSTNSTGIINSGRNLDGTGNSLTATSGVQTGDFTGNIWFKSSDSTLAHRRVICINGGVSLGLCIAGRSAYDSQFRLLQEGVAWDTDNQTTSNNYYDGIWHMATVTWDGTTSKLYIDTVLEGSILGVGSVGTTTYIGANSAYTNAWNGNLDEGAIWSRVVTTAEMENLYSGRSPPIFNDTQVDAPIVTLNYPTDNLNFTTSPITINFNCSVYDNINLTEVKLLIDDVVDQTNASGINNTDYIFSKTFSTEGAYTWTCEAFNNESESTKPTARNFIIHTTNPNATIHYPTGTKDYHLSGDSLVLNWTIQETGENLTTHIKNCTYEYNGIITEINNTVCTQINQTTFIPVPGLNTLNFTVTDEFGLVNTTSTTWNIKVFEINQTYNNETTEGNLETFLATLRLGSGYSISDAVLISYNGTITTGQSFASGSNTVLRKTDYLIPNVEADTNVTFYWNITLSDSTNLQLEYHNQTIYNLDLDNCAVNTVELFNFTVVDEEKQTILPNATIEIAINVYDENMEELILNYSNLFEGENPLRVCMNRNLSSDSMYLVDTAVRYEDTGNANEYYNIVGQELTNGTASQIITLYDLNLTDSTDFQLTFTGSDFLPIENALVYVDRQYISENTFKTVELPKTDYNGQSVLHLVRNDVIYNIGIVKDGVVLGNFENLVAFCDDFTIGDCNIELNAFDSVESVFNVDEALGIIYTSPVYNKTANTISFNFLTSDGTAKTVLLEVTRNDIFGNRSICNSTLISSGGTLTCNIDPNLDESVLMVSIYVDGVLTVLGSVELDTTNFGVAGYLVMFVMAMSFIFMFSGSKTGVLISIGLTFAGALGMGIVSGDLIGVGASGIWLLVIIFVGIYKLNKDMQS